MQHPNIIRLIEHTCFKPIKISYNTSKDEYTVLEHSLSHGKLQRVVHHTGTKKDCCTYVTDLEKTDTNFLHIN